MKVKVFSPSQAIKRALPLPPCAYTVVAAPSTVYATGGRGNTRLISWAGERTVTFTMEDALISPMGLAVLAGAGIIQTTNAVHITERVAVVGGKASATKTPLATHKMYYGNIQSDGSIPDKLTEMETPAKDITDIDTGVSAVFVDYYASEASTTIDIVPEILGGNFYLEAATLFRDVDGVDHAAEFIIPNCRVQSNFTFSMAATGDPSTFTFTMDAFPGYTAYDKTKKVLCAIQVLGESDGSNASNTEEE